MLIHHHRKLQSGHGLISRVFLHPPPPARAQPLPRFAYPFAAAILRMIWIALSLK